MGLGLLLFRVFSRSEISRVPPLGSNCNRFYSAVEWGLGILWGVLTYIPRAGVTGMVSGRPGEGWAAPSGHLHTGRDVRMLGGTASLTLHKALLLSNHAWGAASASYLPAVSSLSDLKPGSNPWSVGCTPKGPWHLGAPARPLRTPRLPTPPFLQEHGEREGTQYAYPYEVPGKGRLRIRVQQIVNLPPLCGFFLPLPAACTRPTLPS